MEEGVGMEEDVGMGKDVGMGEKPRHFLATCCLDRAQNLSILERGVRPP